MTITLDTPTSQIFDAAREVATELAATAVERERANATPHAEMDLLRSRGLLDAIIPARLGGGGLTWSEALEVVRIVSAADTSIGQLLGQHYVVVTIARLRGSEEQYDALMAESAAHSHFWVGPINPRDPDVVATRTADGGLVLNGHKSFASGVTLAQRFLLLAVEDGVHRWSMVPADRAGLLAEDASWDHLGQRLTATGTLTLDDVRVEPSEVLTRPVDANPVTSTLVTPLMQAVFANVYLGAARGALVDAAEYVRTQTRPWVHSGQERAQDEPYAIERFGEFYTELLASEALAARANASVEALLEVPEEQLTAEMRGEVAVEVYALKVHATRTSLDITSRVFEVMGARAAALKLGHDRRWRDVRTHTLHDPAVWKTHDVGTFALTGAYPQPDPVAYR